MTQLGLFGRYRPPFGRLGALTDDLAGHRIVVDSVDRFLDDLVEQLHAALPVPSPDETSQRTELAEVAYDSRTCSPGQLVELLEHDP
jgi:hypothetical protein